MKTSRVLLILAAILSFDLSLFQAALSLRPEWFAAFGVPPGMLADREWLLAAGLFTSLVLALCGIYALSGAGTMKQLPYLRLGLLVIGCGYLFLGAGVISKGLIFHHQFPPGGLILLRLVVATMVVLTTGLSYLAGVTFGWERLSAGRREAPLSGARPAAAVAAQRQNQG